MFKVTNQIGQLFRCLIVLSTVTLSCSVLAQQTDSTNSTLLSQESVSSNPRVVLITANDHDTDLECTFGTVKIKKRSVVYALDNGRELAVYNLLSVPDGVKVSITNGSTIPVHIGQELLLTRSEEGSFKEIQPFYRLVCLAPKEIEIGNGLRGFLAHFHNVDAMWAIPELMEKYKSKDVNDRRLITSLLLPQMAQLVPKSHSTTKGQKLSNSNLVLYEKEARTIQTKLAAVTCAASSVVFVCEKNDSVAVFVFDQAKKGDVKVDLEGKSFSVPVGEEVVVTNKSNATFQQVNPLRISFRHLTPKAAVVGDRYIYRAEFMIQNAIEVIYQLRKLADSTDPEERKLIDRILKNAAILQSDAGRAFIGGMCAGPVRKIIAETGSIESKPGVLSGSVEEFDAPDAKLIDLRIDRSAAVPESDIYWLEPKQQEWVKLAAPTDDQKAALLVCSQDCAIKTELSTITCRKGSTVFVDNHKHAVTICTFDSRGLKDVVVHTKSGHQTTLRPGRAIVVAKPGAAEAADLIKYRGWSEMSLDGVELHTADFSIPSAMYVFEPLRKMALSKDRKERARADSILKNAAILAYIDP